MNLSSAILTTGLSVRAVPVSSALPSSGKRLTASATIGTQAAVSYPDANIAYATTIEANADEDEATLALDTAAFTATVGTPFQTGGVTDFNGVAIPAAVTLYAIRLTTPATNATGIDVATLIAAVSGGVKLPPGASVTIGYAAAGVTLDASDQLEFIIGTAGDTITAEILAATA